MINCKIVRTKYLGPTNFRGSRIQASDDNGNRITVGYRSELSPEDNHVEAAKALGEKIREKHKAM